MLTDSGGANGERLGAVIEQGLGEKGSRELEDFGTACAVCLHFLNSPFVQATAIWLLPLPPHQEYANDSLWGPNYRLQWEDLILSDRPT